MGLLPRPARLARHRRPVPLFDSSCSVVHGDMKAKTIVLGDLLEGGSKELSDWVGLLKSLLSKPGMFDDCGRKSMARRY